jgi:mannose-6-phosphate isomerase-like protein (cupin superfamily)
VKSFDLAKLAEAQGGEYVLAARDLDSRACYLVYGHLKPGEQGRLIKPGDGYEEILCAVTGSLLMKLSGREVALEQGHAVHIKPTDSFYVSNPNNDPVVYVIAGGRSESDQG